MPETSRPKLVRDRIPEIISAQGLEPIVYTAAEDERVPLLLEKLAEEAKELAEAFTLAGGYGSADVHAELADVLEVLHALAWRAGLTPGRLDRIRAARTAERGGFWDWVVWCGNRPAGGDDGA